MNLRDYRKLLNVFHGKLKHPKRGMCPLVKARKMAVGPQCINCAKFYIESKNVILRMDLFAGERSVQNGKRIRF